MHKDFDDDGFMAQFEHRLALEPKPQWVLRKTPFPWLEIGWAFAAAFLLALYWTELRFGLFSAGAVIEHVFRHVSTAKIFIFAAAGLTLVAWLAPKFAREI